MAECYIADMKKNKPARTARKKSSPVKTISLALQGGGAHGAYSWGVLDRLLADDRLRIEGISGTSAGAMNAVVLAHGMVKGGSTGARDALKCFWDSIADMPGFGAFTNPLVEKYVLHWQLDQLPQYQFFDQLSRSLSPYQLNPFNVNPLRQLLKKFVDFELIQKTDHLSLFVSATNVRTGRARIFSRPEITLDALLASACLPYLFQAVEIDGDPYWDGGFVGNPPLWPLYETMTTPDLMLVNINPLERVGTPANARDIINRMNEISFNSTLMLEMRSVDFVQRLLNDNKLDPKKYRRIYMHMVDAEDRLRAYDASSKLNNDRGFIDELFTIGYQTAELWLQNHFDDLGQRPTVNIRRKFL